MNKIVYVETQTVSSFWKYLFGSLLILCFALMHIHSVFGLGVFLFSMLTLLALNLKLNIVLYENHIEYTLKPTGQRTIVPIEAINSIELAPFNQFGVKGFRVKKTFKGVNYYFGTPYVLKIVTNDHKHTLISIENEKEVQKYIDRINN